MYDEIPFDEENGILRLADAGLNGLYVMDCDALAEIAAVLGKKKIEEELSARAEKYRKNLQRLWCDKTGIFLNRRMDTGEFDKRISPTNFYPLIGNAASIGQAQRMITEHFYNENEFWGEWIMPSISRDNPAFADQDYWRGRIWAPMNFLVYLGLKNYNLGDSVNDISEKSATLLLKEWGECRHVHENYCAMTGEGCNKPNSDRFYNWGGLLGVMKLMENKL
jgi:glycogen debranching enzyme